MRIARAEKYFIGFSCLAGALSVEQCFAAIGADELRHHSRRLFFGLTGFTVLIRQKRPAIGIGAAPEKFAGVFPSRRRNALPHFGHGKAPGWSAAGVERTGSRSKGRAAYCSRMKFSREFSPRVMASMRCSHWAVVTGSWTPGICRWL